MVSLRTCVFAGIHYLIHPQKLGTITATINPDSILPVTLLNTDEIFSDDLDRFLEGLAKVDDVFIPEFGSVLVEKTAPGKDAAASDGVVYVESRQVFQLNGTDDSLLKDMNELPSGPYILYGPNLYQAWRLYEDELDAFVFGVVPEDAQQPDRFQVANALSSNGVYKAIPVPSRLYHPHASIQKPLSGVRVSISDAMSLNGVGSTMSSHAWMSVYPDAANKSGSMAQKLLDLGAVIVGKTKVSPLTSGEDWVDFPAPWNPRGDGYQRPDAASPGAGAAIAGYSWLKHAFAEHGIGNLRNRISGDGVYSLRLSLPEPPMDHWEATSVRDRKRTRARILGLSLEELESTAKAILGSSTNPKQHAVKRILCFRDIGTFGGYPLLYSKRFDKLVSLLEREFGVQVEEARRPSHLWSQDPLIGENRDFNKFIGEAPVRTALYDEYHKYQDFRERYHRKFSRDPFVEKTTDFKWGIGGEVTEKDLELNLDRIHKFQSWFYDRVFNDSTTIVIFPHGIVVDQYRLIPYSRYPSNNAGLPPVQTCADTRLGGLGHELFPLVLNASELVIPFDQNPYYSKIFDNREQLPLRATVMGPEGSELTLLKIIRDGFTHAKWPTVLDVGRVAFPDNAKDVSADGSNNMKEQKEDNKLQRVSLFEL